jgi:hypothetical protein
MSSPFFPRVALRSPLIIQRAALLPAFIAGFGKSRIIRLAKFVAEYLLKAYIGV